MTDSPLDLEALAELQLVMEDEFETLLNTFLDDSVQRVAAIKATRNEPDALRRAAHAFKGSSSNVGALVLAECCLELETRCRADRPLDPEQLDALIAAIEDSLEQTRTELQHHFSIR